MRIDKRVLDNLPEWMASRDDIPDGWMYLGDDKERYILGQPGRYNMLVFGVNPSMACAGNNNLDPTTRKVRDFVAESEYDGWIMANLYPLRATKSDELPEKADPKLLENNMKVLRAVMKSYVIGAAWAAWGNSIDSRFYLGESLCRIEEEQIGDFEWFYRGKKTNDGNPRHPLYMKAGEKFEWFPVFDYAGYWRYPELY